MCSLTVVVGWGVSGPYAAKISMAGPVDVYFPFVVHVLSEMRIRPYILFMAVTTVDSIRRGDERVPDP